ncbi:MAG: hypothetical protein FJ405_12940 [Verrucomicrobia bacterium]|nr:hypothetical protein [Verrucomicrobiota bacterium]
MAGILQSLQFSNTVYLLSDAEPRIDRYNLESGRFLDPIRLPATYGLPTAFLADPHGLYVAFNRSLKRYSLEGSNEVHVISRPMA